MSPPPPPPYDPSNPSAMDPLNASVLRALAEHMPYRIFWKDLDGFYLGCNTAFAQDAGMGDPAALIGLSDFDMPWSDEEARHYRECDNKIIESGVGMTSMEEPQHRPDGSTSWLETSKAPLRDTEGKIIGVIGMYRDVTEQHEEKEQLERAHREALEANRLKTNFISTVSHEVRTPLTSVLGYGELIERAIDKGEPNFDQIRAHLQTIRRNSQQLLSIVSDVLDISRMESGELGVESVSTPVPEILRDALDEARETIGDRDIDASAELATPIPTSVLSDPLRLRQVLGSVVQNAIKFTDAGRVRIITGLYSSVTPEGASQELRIDVVDTGRGVPAGMTESIFEPFTQGDPFERRRTGGAGLGLCVARRLMDEMGGSITCESKEGEGSTFSIRVPVSGKVVPTVHTLEKTRHVAGPSGDEEEQLSGRVLLAEDAPDSARLLIMHLERMGLDVVHAEDGAEAIEFYDEHEGAFDLVLMDIQMPEVDGLEATRRLRSRGFAGPVYALTAHALATHHTCCNEAGCDRVLTKPISRDALRQAVSDALRRGSARRAA